jgi:NDP-sugar pyrophosphorylase family protein
MKAILHTGMTVDWVPDPDLRPWSLLPVGNRPVLEYWLETCVVLGIQEVRIVLGEGADLIEGYAGEGENWGLNVTYSFLKPGKDPDVFPRRSPDQWKEDGLLYIRMPVFPMRTADTPPCPPKAGQTFLLESQGRSAGFISRDPEVLRAFLDEGRWPERSSDTEWGLSAAALSTPKTYFDLNMTMVQGGISRYVAPGYSVTEGSYVGFNVVIPPSSQMNPPVMIGNNSRFQPLTIIGPEAVIGNRVVIDTQTEIRKCVVLDGTYLGRNLEFEDKIIAGTHLIDPETGVDVDLNDPLLLGQVGVTHTLREAIHSLAGKIPALLLWVLMAPLFFILAPIVIMTGRGRFEKKTVLGRKDRTLTVWSFIPRPGSCLASLFRGLNLDRWLWLPHVLLNRLALCGHSPLSGGSAEKLRTRLPRYSPAVFAEDLLIPDPVPEPLWEIYALQYLHERTMGGDAALLFRVLTRRLLMACCQDSLETPTKE